MFLYAEVVQERRRSQKLNWAVRIIYTDALLCRTRRKIDAINAARIFNAALVDVAAMGPEWKIQLKCV